MILFFSFQLKQKTKQDNKVKSYDKMSDDAQYFNEDAQDALMPNHEYFCFFMNMHDLNNAYHRNNDDILNNIITWEDGEVFGTFDEDKLRHIIEETKSGEADKVAFAKSIFVEMEAVIHPVYTDGFALFINELDAVAVADEIDLDDPDTLPEGGKFTFSKTGEVTGAVYPTPDGKWVAVAAYRQFFPPPRDSFAESIVRFH